MQFIILAALLATLAQSDASTVVATPVESASSWRWLLVVLTTLAAPLATACDGGWFVVRLRQQSQTMGLCWQQASQRYERFQLAALWLWLACSLALIYLLNWPAVVRDDLGWRAWPLVDEALILLPVVGSLVLLWVTFYLVERSACRIKGISARASSLWSYLSWNVRHYLALATIPAFAIIAVQEIFAGSGAGAGLAGSFSRGAWLVAIPVLIALPVLLPLVLARIWPTVDLPAGELRDELVRISWERNTPLTRLLVWQTEGRMTNAAVAGISRWCRYLFLTDALLVQLAPEEIAAVVRHELGHLQRKHLLQRLLVLALPLLAGMALQATLGFDFDWFASSSPSALVAAGCYVVYAALVVGQLSHWIEYDADLAAILDTDGQVNPDYARDLIYTLAVLQGPQRESRLAHWLHPPTSARIAWIRRVLMQPEEGMGFRRKLDLLARVIYGLVVALAVIVLLAPMFALGPQ
jgi:Zn-dependent protease with chaperone function